MEALANSVLVPNFADHLYPSLQSHVASHTTCSSSYSSSSSSCSWSSVKSPSKRIGSLKISEKNSALRLRRRHAVSAEASGFAEAGDNNEDIEEDDDGKKNDKSLNDGLGLVNGDIISLSQESNHYTNKEKENPKSRGRGIVKRSKKKKSTAPELPKTTVQQTNNKFGGLSTENALNASPNTSHPILAHHGGGTRAGLFRTPISGGVQSATSAHGLPRPALAVRNLMEQARFAHLCTIMSQMHHRRQGYPFGSLVDFAPDSTGHPIFSFSPLAIHTRNLLADPRCTLVVQIPGWSGLSNARVTIFGDVYPLPEHQQEWAHKQYIAKHQQGPSQQWGNFYYFRMQNISDIYFIGGFGTVAWVDVKEYEAIQPDKIAVDGGEQNLKELNAMFSKPLKELLSSETEVDDAALISIDSRGIDIRVRQGAQFNIQRISFDEGQAVETLAEAKEALWKLIKKGRVFNLQK